MRSLLDVVGSAAIGIYFMYMVVNFNIKMSENVNESVIKNIAKWNVIGLNKLFDYDFNKIGFRVDSTDIFSVAKEDEFNYLADVDNDGNIDEVHYILGDEQDASSTANPDDKPLYRIINDNDTTINMVKTFEFSYFDSSGIIIPTSNLTQATERRKIKGLKVVCNIESPFASNGEYQDAEFKKKCFPKNLF